MKMNLPTKITFTRIIFIALMILGLLTLEIISFINPTLIPSSLITYDVGGAKLNLVYLIVCGFFIIASATDWLDGYLARKNNQVTDLGKFLDPVADKLLVNCTIIFLCVPQIYAEEQMAFPLFCAIFIIARDIVVDMLRFMAAKKNVVIAANIFGKLKTIFQMVTIPLVLLNDWPFSYFDSFLGEYFSITHIFVYLTTLISIVSGVIYVYQYRKAFIDEK